MQPSLDVDGERHHLEKQRCLTKVRWVSRKLWKNHILPQHDKEKKGANETYLDDILKFCEIMLLGNMRFRNNLQQSLSKGNEIGIL